MAEDIDPTSQVSKFTPRDSNLVDAVAAAARISEQQMRSNPLTDARIDSGLTKWTGNYGGDLAWFGEFFPADQNQFDQYGHVRPQRGISFVRDDPLHNSAFSMYDFDPRPGAPLRQRIYFHDADGKDMWMEGYSGGRAFPDTPFVMYQRESIDPVGASFTSDRVMYSGEGNLTGNRFDFLGVVTCSDGAATSISMFLQLSGGGVTINTPTVTQAGGGNHAVDIDIDSIFDATDFLNVEWHVWRVSGAGTYVPRLYRSRNYSRLTA